MVRRSCLLSSPFSVHTAGERPIGAVPFRRAVAWQGVLLVEPSRDPESPAGGTAVNLAMSARLLGLTRTKKKKEVTSCSCRLFLSSLKGPVSFKCFCFLDEVYNFTFLYISLKKQNKTKLWSHCKRNHVLAFFPELWLDLESFAFWSRYNRSGEFHKVVYEDRPGTWERTNTGNLSDLAPTPHRITYKWNLFREKLTFLIIVWHVICNHVSKVQQQVPCVLGDGSFVMFLWSTRAGQHTRLVLKFPLDPKLLPVTINLTEFVQMCEM